MSLIQPLPSRPTENRSGRTTYRLFLMPSRENRLGGILGRLASFFGLDVYSDSLLGRRARIEMKTAALMLFMNFLVDFGAWTLLLNAALHSEARSWDIVWTPVAFVGGLIFAIIIMLYERQFFIADSSSRWKAAMVFRGLIIFAAAVVTTQPVELLFFQGPIARRVQDEGIRQAVVSLRQKLDKVKKDREEHIAELGALADRLKREIEYIDKTAKEKAATEAVQQQEDVQARLERARANVSVWAERLSRREVALAAVNRESDLAPEIGQRRQRASEEVQEAKRMRSFWHEQVGKLGGDLVSADREVKVSEAERRAAEETFKQRRNQIEQQIQDAKRQAEGERERLQAWVGQLLQTSPAAGHKIWEARPSADRFWYLLPKYDVFEQLRVLEDLRAGRPPLWQGASTEMKNQLAEEYGLVDPQPCRPRTPCDSLTWERHLARTHTYLVSWIVVFFIALIPPALVMAMKLLMSQDLKDYYSAEQQATDGTTGSLPTNLTAAGLSRI